MENFCAASSSMLLAGILLVDFITAFVDTISDGATVHWGFQITIDSTPVERN